MHLPLSGRRRRWPRAVPGLLALLLLVLSRPELARADDRREARARALYETGRAAFEAGHFDQALDSFRRAYLLEQEPALLYNMASALQSLDQPARAAEELRAYLRARAHDPDRAAIETRIRGLEEAQRLIDLERLKAEPPRLLTLPKAATRWTPRRIGWTVGGSVAGVIVVTAVGLGLGLGLQTGVTPTTLGARTVTP